MQDQQQPDSTDIATSLTNIVGPDGVMQDDESRRFY